ncbi:hypothetical protein JAAARDRAFT_276215 [Jaapia argillacea MUCL 33604]|uniref:Uncharacterized protein n=1 Tax=Jaapia argillacea MUCL 33604 TaxID=933084 RepID=A0A067Q2T2_9AGAM|nr:hypothetical protein JAAARDRAFT_276215 [Jaapia argillacea MUCL 33604]
MQCRQSQVNRTDFEKASDKYVRCVEASGMRMSGHASCRGMMSEGSCFFTLKVPAGWTLCASQDHVSDDRGARLTGMKASNTETIASCASMSTQISHGLMQYVLHSLHSTTMVIGSKGKKFSAEPLPENVQHSQRAMARVLVYVGGSRWQRGASIGFPGSQSR